MWWMYMLVACRSGDGAEPGTASPDWSGDVALDEDFTVAAGQTLAIEPGTTVTLAPGVALVVDGELLARGTEDSPITFTGDAAAPWRSLVFEAGAADAEFEGVGDYASGSIVENAVIEHATRGMELAGASPYVHAVQFRGNEIPATLDTVGGAALLVRDGATPRIRDCVFDQNIANTFAFGGAVYVDHADPIFQDDVFTGNSASYGGAIATDFMASPIVGSAFDGNDSESDGGAVALVSSVSAILGSAITGNTAVDDGGGVHVCVDCNPHAAPYLFDDVITGNSTSAASPDDGAGGVGAAFLGALESTDLYGNLRAGVPSDFTWFNLASEAWPGWVTAPALSDVWWGTTDEAAIAATIWDGADDATYTAVAVDPVRSGPIAGSIPRAVISSRKLQYVDPGDDVPVFLTIYNPGPEVTAILAISEGGAPFTGEIGYPGAVADGGGWTITMPENSVWFGTIADTAYDGSSGDVSWQASLADGAGAAIGVPVVARYLYGSVQ